MRQRGFTLLEMVVAFTILGLSITGLYACFESSLSRIRKDAKRSEASLIAESLLARATIEWPSSEAAHFGEEHGFQYRLTMQPESKGIAEQSVIEIRVIAEVSWMQGRDTQSVHVETIKLESRPERAG